MSDIINGKREISEINADYTSRYRRDKQIKQVAVYIMTEFSTLTACGECCAGCSKKLNESCPGCVEADGCVPEWAESGRCKIHACARDHGVQFCGLCELFPCEKLPAMIPWNADIIDHLSAIRDEYLKQREA